MGFCGAGWLRKREGLWAWKGDEYKARLPTPKHVSFKLRNSFGIP